MRQPPLSVLGAVLAVLALGVLAFVWIAQGGEKSDEQAVRDWFQTPAGGAASQGDAAAIHVGLCEFTDYSTPAGAVQMCPITTDEPTTPTLHTCFVLSGGKVKRGGWQLAKVGSCNSLRFDRRSGELIDIPAHAHYRITTN